MTVLYAYGTARFNRRRTTTRKMQDIALSLRSLLAGQMYFRDIPSKISQFFPLSPAIGADSMSSASVLVTSLYLQQWYMMKNNKTAFLLLRHVLE